MINEERLITRFRALAAIDNPSGQERGICDALKKELTKLGFTVEEDEAYKAFGGTAGNLFATLPGTLPGSPLLFVAHMDSVPPASSKHSLVMQDGTIRTDGETVLGADDLAGISVILEAVTSILESGTPHRNLELLFTVQEELYSAGIHQFDCSRLASKEAYVMDLTGPTGHAACAAPSLIRFRTVFQGRAAHAGLAPEKGISAIAAAAKTILQLPLGRHGDVILNVGTIRGGSTDNTVPAECAFSGEIRSYSGAAAEALSTSIQAIAETTAAEMGATVRYTANTLCKAWAVAEDAPVCRRFVEKCASLSLEPELIRLQSGSDNETLSRAGISGLVLAVGKYQGHTCDEFLKISEFLDAARLTEALMLAED